MACSSQKIKTSAKSSSQPQNGSRKPTAFATPSPMKPDAKPPALSSSKSAKPIRKWLQEKAAEPEFWACSKVHPQQILTFCIVQADPSSGRSEIARERS